MRSISPPSETTSKLLKLCAESVRDGGLKIRLYGLDSTLKAQESKYKARAATSSLFKMLESRNVGDWVSGDEMSDLYDKTFVKSAKTRSIYNSIKLLAPKGICPLCNQRGVSTLDHHLPKAYHPALAISPVNLVPACKDCNTDSSARRLMTSADQTLHPYYHSVDHAVWLTGSFDPVALAVTFSADPPPHWPPDLSDIVRNHFKEFGLNALYSTHAAVEIVNIGYDMASVFSAGGSAVVSADLSEKAANRRKVVRNTWQAALYDALATSSFFCGGGFKKFI